MGEWDQMMEECRRERREGEERRRRGRREGKDVGRNRATRGENMA